MRAALLSRDLFQLLGVAALGLAFGQEGRELVLDVYFAASADAEGL